MDSQRLGLSILVTIISVLNLAAQSDVDRLKSQLKETQDQLQKERSTKESLQWSIVNNGVASEARVDTLTKKVAAATRSASAGIAEQVKAANDSALERAARLKATGDRAAKAAEEASTSVSTLKEQLWQAQETNRHSNQTLLITGGFGFLGLLIPVIMVFATRYEANQKAAADHQAVLDKITLIQTEAHLANENAVQAQVVSQKSKAVLDAKVDQIHTLVNSNLTDSLKNELQAREDILALLEEALGVKPSVKTTGLIESAKLKITSLKLNIAEREGKTMLADSVLASVLKRRSTDPKESA